MKFTNHNSNRFMATTDNIGQSLVNDVWTITNKIDLALCRWQDAADNGYGFAPWWGDATDLVLDGFDWFCANALRNLVAILVYVALIATELCKRAWATGKIQSFTIDAAKKAKPTALCIGSAGLVAISVLVNPARMFDAPLPSIDPDAHLIDGVPADVWVMRRIVVG